LIFKPLGAFGRRACSTVTLWPPTVSVALLVSSVVFSDTATVTDPLPLADPGVTETHDAPLDAAQPQLDRAAITVTFDVLGSDPTVSEVGETVNAQDVPAWVTVTGCPATMTVPVRVPVSGLAVKVSSAVPLPLSDAGLTVIHGSALDVVHVQAAADETETAAVPAPAATDNVVGLTVNVHTRPAWVTVIGCPATVTVPVRGLVLVLAPTETVADPLPLPDVGLTVIHDAPLDVVQPQPDGAVTVIVEAVVPAATDSSVGEAVKVQATPAWVTVTDRPATVTVAARAPALGLAATAIVTTPSPLPDAGLTVIHGAVVDADQPQPAEVVTLTLEVPASAATDSVVGATVNVQDEPDWVTVTASPATVTMPVRALAPVLAAMLSVTAPLPLPEAGLTVIHDTLLVAVQPQPEGAVTVTLDVPAPAAADTVAGVTENVQSAPAWVTVTL
jgi:hypothetical protein